jgi:alkanesulfonate monooxygenase SsuD/methylene tetrahydromethanopterin reductase-like flavin-dependent oxidoreductase (luciferase family)
MSERLGLSVPADGMAGLPELARRAEQLGWTDAWSMESRMFDAFTPLAATAAVTEHMRLGTAIVAAFLRPPGVTAMHAAALAGLAPGRFVLGLGSSTEVVVEQWHGVRPSGLQSMPLEIPTPSSTFVTRRSGSSR